MTSHSPVTTDGPSRETEETDLCLYGGTEGAAFMAVTAARAGMQVLWVLPRDYLHGVLPSLGAWETHYPGVRSPLTHEFCSRILRYYAETYGEDSEELRVVRTRESNNPMITFEPGVAEKVLNDMVLAEDRIQIRRGWRAKEVSRKDRRLEEIRFAGADHPAELAVRAAVFADLTYEGDLADLAGVPWRLGRESRAEHGETHAGKLFSRYIPGKFPLEAVHGRLNLLPKWSTMGLMAGSTGEGDGNIQAYCYRICLTDRPENRMVPEAPPAGYDADRYLGILEDPAAGSTAPCPLQHRFMLNTLDAMLRDDHLIHGHQLPRGKRSWNATNFTGAGREYALADPSRRREIEREHLDHALGILYFLQNDPRVPPAIRERAREWGLARDEFLESDNLPPQMYVREARRIEGRYTLTEHDCTLAPGLGRAPLHEDAVGITEFPIDSLDCTTERMPYSMNDGQFFLMEYSRPGQVPWRCLLPKEVDNLLVPIAASVTHVAWGTYRQTPTYLHTCESAGLAVVMAVEEGCDPANLDAAALQLRLVNHGIMIAFFNDIDMAENGGRAAPLQWLAARGFFPDYNARPEEPVGAHTAACWLDGYHRLRSGDPAPPMELARALRSATAEEDPPLSAKALHGLIREKTDGDLDPKELPAERDGVVTRLSLARWIWRQLGAAVAG